MSASNRNHHLEEDNVKMHLHEIGWWWEGGVMDRFYLAQDRDRWLSPENPRGFHKRWGITGLADEIL